MATTLLPIDPASSPQRVSRILTISASLLPEETLAKRRARRALIVVALVVLAVAGLCGAWFGYAYHQKQAAEADLQSALTVVRGLQRDQREFSPVVRVKNETTTLTDQLNTVMADDLDWAALLDTLRRTGTPSGIQIDGVNGQLTGDEKDRKAATGTLPGTGTSASVGSLVVTGSAPDKRAVAAYADALAKQTVVANPFVTAVATREGGATFSLTLDITQKSLCGRFTDPCKLTGGN